MKESIVASINNIRDRGSYLRGLLVLISKDKVVHDHEKEIFLEEGGQMGYSKDYLHSSLTSVLRNQYVIDTPPVFHFKRFAVKLIKKGITIINKDKTVHPHKVIFLKNTARANNLLTEWESEYFSRILPKTADTETINNRSPQ